MRDEFKRILSLSPSSEIKGICKRALTQTGQNVPVLKQLERATAELSSARLDRDRMTWLEDNGVRTCVEYYHGRPLRFEPITREWIDGFTSSPHQGAKP
jgi:hypothetical protein